MKKYFVFPLLLTLFAFTFYSCSEKEVVQVTIAISKTNSNYSSWVETNDEKVKWINLYPLGIDSALKVLATCDGLLVTGGEDVYPDLYGKISDTSRCGSFDRYRDSLELELIKNALKTDKPIFGVCRGLQILNVALGGTLIIDIPSDFDTTVVHRQKDWQNCYHEVSLEPGSLIFSTSKVTDGVVNSNHHQGIERLGTGLRISSYSLDSLPESIEWEDPKGKGFLMAVQWHPERMEKDHPLAMNLAIEFIQHTREYQMIRK